MARKYGADLDGLLLHIKKVAPSKMTEESCEINIAELKNVI